MANVSEALFDWSNVGGSNQPDSGDAATVQADLQAIQAGVRGWLAHVGSDIASAATTDIGAVEGKTHTITGTTTITAFGTVSAGIEKTLVFAGALTLTHNATSLILPGAANITTAAGDVAKVVSLGAGNWRCTSFMRAAAEPLAFATQAQQETGTSTVVAVSPGRQQFHPSAAKAWLKADVAGNINASYNITSITDAGTGQLSVTIATDFSSAHYAIAPGIEGASLVIGVDAGSPAAGSFGLNVRNLSGALTDPTSYFCVAFGDQ